MIVDAELRGLEKRFGWTITLTGVAASVEADVAVASSLGLTALIVHAAPPAVLALALEAWLSTMRGDAKKRLPERPRRLPKIRRQARRT